jgi:hypothetical protein
MAVAGLDLEQQGVGLIGIASHRPSPARDFGRVLHVVLNVA